jgi:hypothetical protein
MQRYPSFIAAAREASEKRRWKIENIDEYVTAEDIGK